MHVLVDLLILLCFLNRQQLNVITIVVIIIATMVTTLAVTTAGMSAPGAGIMHMHAGTVPFRNLIEFNLFTHLFLAYQVLL